jgi:kinesin family protein 2/24
MALKECMRNRALAAIHPEKDFHIPYRNSKLTLMLKDSFELCSNKLSKTVVIANVAPGVADLAMTKNTLRFVTPIKVGAGQKARTDHL